jgi:signal peptidase I
MKGTGSHFYLFTLLLSAFFFVIVIFIVFNIGVYRVYDRSMEPTLPEGSLVLVFKRHFSPIRVGDIVVFNNNNDNRVVKRCFLAPNDVIFIENNILYNNEDSVELDSSMVQYLSRWQRVPAHNYFFVGDNRTLSYDSRSYGLIPKSALIGRVFTLMMG